MPDTDKITSASFPNGIGKLRSEDEVRASRAKRSLEDLRAKMEEAGESPAMIEEVIRSTEAAFAYGDMFGSILKRIGL